MSLVQAEAVGPDDEALVLDMRDPATIDSNSQQLISRFGKQVEIADLAIVKNFRPEGESDDRAAHPLISHAKVSEFSAIGLANWMPGTNESSRIETRRKRSEPMAQEVVCT